MAALLLLKSTDNVLIACRELQENETVCISNNECITVKQRTPLGFKIARLALQSGTLIVKYSMPIGQCISEVRAGELLHSHNMKSQYIPSHQRGGHSYEE